jgi:hypothetical protein
MNEIKTLADQLRSRMAKPDTPRDDKAPPKKKCTKLTITPPIVELLRGYDIKAHNSMVHVRFDRQTAQMLHHFKMATGVEVTRLISYSVAQLLEQHPEIKTIIKEHLENFGL